MEDQALERLEAAWPDCHLQDDWDSNGDRYWWVTLYDKEGEIVGSFDGNTPDQAVNAALEAIRSWG